MSAQPSPSSVDLRGLNHELYQLMNLHREMRRSWWRFYPKVMRRAADVAYAAHLRVLLEFFHNGRDQADLRRVGCPKANDLHVAHVIGTRHIVQWSDEELGRLCDADKLLGHLSKDRSSRTSDWGRDQDWELIRDYIDGLLAVSYAGLGDAQVSRARLP